MFILKMYLSNYLNLLVINVSFQNLGEANFSHDSKEKDVETKALQKNRISKSSEPTSDSRMVKKVRKSDELCLHAQGKL